MKKFSMEVQQPPESEIEKLCGSIVDRIERTEKDTGYELAESSDLLEDGGEVPEEEVNELVKSQRTSDVDRIIEMIADSVFADRLKVTLDAYVSGVAAEEIITSIKNIMLDSEELAAEKKAFEAEQEAKFEAVAPELHKFVETKIMDSEGVSERSKWGNAFRDYENGNSDRLREVLKEFGAESEENKVVASRYLSFLDLQKFDD